MYICYDRHFPEGARASGLAARRSCSSPVPRPRASANICGSSNRPRTRSPTATSSARSTASAQRRRGTSANSTAELLLPIRAARSSRREPRQGRTDRRGSGPRPESQDVRAQCSSPRSPARPVRPAARHAASRSQVRIADRCALHGIVVSAHGECACGGRFSVVSSLDALRVDAPRVRRDGSAERRRRAHVALPARDDARRRAAAPRQRVLRRSPGGVARRSDAEGGAAVLAVRVGRRTQGPRRVARRGRAAGVPLAERGGGRLPRVEEATLLGARVGARVRGQEADDVPVRRRSQARLLQRRRHAAARAPLPRQPARVGADERSAAQPAPRHRREDGRTRTASRRGAPTT